MKLMKKGKTFQGEIDCRGILKQVSPPKKGKLEFDTLKGEESEI